jgi:hypothetical protein
MDAVKLIPAYVVGVVVTLLEGLSVLTGDIDFVVREDFNDLSNLKLFNYCAYSYHVFHPQP